MLKMIPTMAVLAALFGVALTQSNTAADSAPSRVASEAVLYSFRGGVDGKFPDGVLLADKTGALYGTSFQGGGITGGLGSVYKLTRAGNGYRENVIHTFRGPDGKWPVGGLIADNTGALYGTTEEGGAAGQGIVYKLTPHRDGYSESILYIFQGGADGANPISSLIADSSGALYGTTTDGFPVGNGSVFKLTPNGNSYTESVLYRFQGGTDGSFPLAPLIVDASGAFFGTTFYGGTYDRGTVFKLTPNGNGYSESILYNFHGGYQQCNVSLCDGSNPEGALLVDGTGALYGTTSTDGVGRDGTVFKLSPHGGGYVEITLHSFGGHDASGPSGTLIADSTGALYGTALFGGTSGFGVVFKLTPHGHAYSESILRSFAGGADGGFPRSTLIMDNSGTLFGTSAGGNFSDVNSDGSVFKLSTNGNAYSVLHRFHWHDDGRGARAGLIADSSGTIYGTTYYGGSIQQGTVFKLTPSSNGYRESVLYRFQGGPDGANPAAGLITDRLGAFYGTTTAGGKFDFGTVFKLTPNGNGFVESVLYRFQGDAYPRAGLLGGMDGALYGATFGGGISCGTVFKLTPTAAGYNFRSLYDFKCGADGDLPYASLIADGAGALYGTTAYGGSAGYGVVYKLTPIGSGYNETVLHAFHVNADDGEHPQSSLIVDSAGALYGTTPAGGAHGAGTVYKLIPTRNGYSESFRYDFRNSPDGAGPIGSLIADGAGALYGTTHGGGADGLGVVFKLVPNGNGYSEIILHSFARGTDGANSFGSLIADSSGALYGTTHDGGALGQGAVFKVIP
jgi:uncharacterized repeat protein (TIGR03803 family)